ncbi:MAG: ROK family protein [Clostridiales bacterium]|nr:ROK family protein [Clostridiales bacterium]
MKEFGFKKPLVFVPEYDKTFFPVSIGNREYRLALKYGEKISVNIALYRGNGLTSVFKTAVFKDGHIEDNLVYIERLIKTLLWLKGGYKVFFGGPRYIGEYLQTVYCKGGEREFDAVYMERIYGKPFKIEIINSDEMPNENENPKKIGGHLNGCRIGFDAGGSDRKVSAIVNGKTIYSEEVVWHPKLSENPQYQYDGILESMKTAAAKMERVDAIGISAAGIYIDNEVKAASLFIKVPEDIFKEKVKRIFFDIADEMGAVPFEVANDGDVTALAGALSLNENGILGIAMGTSEAGGYVDKKGYITGWLNELAFVPIDYSKNSMEDEWAGDIGCGVKYFSQDGIIKLAEAAGIKFENGLSPAEKLNVVQSMMAKNDYRAIKIYEGIGYYLGYAIAYYVEFYDINHVLLLGRVTSGRGGDIIIEKANKVLEIEFPELAKDIKVSMPDEKARRIGQSVAAASLPEFNG